MSLLEMKRRLDSVPQPDIHAALAEFEAQLIALSQPPKVQHLPATQGESFFGHPRSDAESIRSRR